MKKFLALAAAVLTLVSCGVGKKAAVADNSPIRVGVIYSGMKAATQDYYRRCLADAGAAEVIFFPQYTKTDAQAAEYVAGVDAIISPGATAADSDDRDECEFRVIRAARAKGIPMLGICFGHQRINKCLGGSIGKVANGFPDCTATHVNKGKKDGKSFNFGLLDQSCFHNIKVEPDSRLRKLIGTDIKVNTSHKLYSKKIAPCLKVVARADDGMPEALEGEHVLTTQFHPEFMYGKLGMKEFLPIFQWLVDDARSVKKSKK